MNQRKRMNDHERKAWNAVVGRSGANRRAQDRQGSYCLVVTDDDSPPGHEQPEVE